MAEPKVCVVVLNWNGEEYLVECLESLQKQTQTCTVLVVDNASTDGSMDLMRRRFPDIMTIVNARNLGFAPGVNAGIRYAMNNGFDYAALLNNDAVADESWLRYLADALEKDEKSGIATCKFLNFTGEYIDSTGDQYTIWGLSYPRGRREADTGKYDDDKTVFGATGGASLYRLKMLEEIGLFDEDLQAYYEDVDLSFRAQLAGWKVVYEPRAKAFHHISASTSRIKGYASYQTLKNLPLLMWKNVPWELMPKVWPRLVVAYSGIALRVLLRGQFGAFFKGTFMGTILWPKKLIERRRIQRGRKVSARYINSIITHDLPPNAHKLRALRGYWWTLSRRKAAR